MSRRLLAAITLLLVFAAACGETEPTAEPSGPATAPSAPQVTPTETASPGPSPSATADGAPTESGEPSEPGDGASTVLAYYVRSGPTSLFAEPVPVDLPEPTMAVARAAYVATVEQDPAHPDLQRAVPDGTRVLDVSIADGVLTVDLSGELTAASGSSSQELALLNVLSETGLQFDTVDSVRLLVEGEPVTDLWGHLGWSEPFVAEEFAVSPIVVLSPRWDATVEGPDVTLEGTANTFEATLELTLTDGDGLILEETFTTATCGTGCRGEWSHTFSDLEPGRHTVVLRAPDPSAGEGPDPFTTEVTFTVE